MVEDHAAWCAKGIASEGARRVAGRHNLKPHPLPERPQGSVHATDPDGRKLRSTFHGLTGYDAQAVVGEGQIVLAAEVTVESGDFCQLEPMVSAARATSSPGLASSTSRRWWSPTPATGTRTRSNRSRARACSRSSPRTPTNARVPGRRVGIYDFMRRVLETDHAAALYKKRQALAEPVFAQTKWNRRVAASSEWRLLTATHDLLKLHQHQIAAT